MAAAGRHLYDAFDINDHGVIVGRASNVYSAERGFEGLVLTPVPQPHTVVLLLAGLGLTVWVARRRRV